MQAHSIQQVQQVYNTQQVQQDPRTTTMSKTTVETASETIAGKEVQKTFETATMIKITSTKNEYVNEEDDLLVGPFRRVDLTFVATLGVPTYDKDFGFRLWVISEQLLPNKSLVITGQHVYCRGICAMKQSVVELIAALRG